MNATHGPACTLWPVTMGICLLQIIKACAAASSKQQHHKGKSKATASSLDATAVIPTSPGLAQ